MSVRPPHDERSFDDLLGMRDVFREEARAILDRLRRRLPELETHLPDPNGLGDVVADGVALKGSGALVGLGVVSRAGILIVRAAELAAERAADDRPGAVAAIAALRASLDVLERLVDICLDGDEAAQEALLAEALDRFPPQDRVGLRSAIDGSEVAVGADPLPGAVDGAALVGLRTALTDILIADTQLGGVEREVEALTAALAPDVPSVRQLADALAARAAPARALARAAAELQRWMRTLDPAATPLEPLVILHVGESRYAVAAADVESVVAVRPEERGRATVLVDGDPVAALDLGGYLGGSAAATPAVAAIVRVSGARLALLVARAEPPRLMVLRPLDALLAHHPLSRAATIGARGEVVFVLRTTALVDAVRGRIAPSVDPR